MISKLFYYMGESEEPHYNLAVEQYLMEQVPKDACILYLWQNRRTVVIGRNQNAWKECRTEELGQNGGYLARRLSGGGAVFHDLGNLNFTFLVSKKNYDLDRQLQVISSACASFGIEVIKSGRNDLLAEGKKFSGNAYYDSKGQAYHHGTLLIDVDMSMLSRYLRPSKAKLESKGVESVKSRVVNLKDFCPGLTVKRMKEQLVTAFEQVYGTSALQLGSGALDQDQILAYRERNRSWDWLYGKKIPFTFACSQRFSWGEVELQAEVQEGRMKDLMVYSDSMDWNLTRDIAEALRGCRMDRSELLIRMKQIPCEERIREDLGKMLIEQEM